MFQTCSLKLIFFMHILFNFNIAQAPNKIHVRYNDQEPFSFDQTILERLRISNVGHLIGAIKPTLESSIENVSEIITLRRGENENLNSETLISELYNTREDALHVVIGKHNIITIFTVMNILVLLLIYFSYL